MDWDAICTHQVPIKICVHCLLEIAKNGSASTDLGSHLEESKGTDRQSSYQRWMEGFDNAG